MSKLSKPAQLVLSIGAAFAILAGVVGLVKAMQHYMGSGTGAPEGAAGTATPTTTRALVSAQDAQACKNAVAGLLAQDLLAMEQGSHFGLNQIQVASQYGGQSKIYRAWSSAHTTLMSAYQAGFSNPMTSAQTTANLHCQS